MKARISCRTSESRSALSILFLVFAVIIGSPSGAGLAQTLAEKQTMTYEDSRLAASIADLNDMCGTTITARFDWPSFLKAGKVGNMNGTFDNPPSHMCNVPLGILESICRNPDYRDAVLTRIKSYVCIYQDGQHESHVLREDGALELHTNYELYHFGETGKAAEFSMHWLMHRLSASNMCPQNCF